MDGIFQEFENENSLRNYPFAAGCEMPEGDREIPPGVFVDAAIYPINPQGPVYLSEVSADGRITVSDSSGAIMSGTPSGGMVELFDLSAFSRHVGTLMASSDEALAGWSGRGVARSYGQRETAFAASCVFPVVLDGVLSVDAGGAGATTGDVSFLNGDTDEVRVSCGVAKDGRDTLRFDVLPRPGIVQPDSIRRIICVVDGETPFRIAKLAYNVVLVTLDGIDKEAVCAAAHREDGLEMADTCECERETPKRVASLPETYQIEEVFIPPDDVPEGQEYGPEGGIAEGAANAFYLVSSNLSGYANPVSVTLEDGVVSPNTSGPETVVDGNDASLADGAMADTVTSKGVVLQVPGLSGGSV